MKRALLVVAGLALGVGLFVVGLGVGDRLGLLRDLSPPPHLKRLHAANGAVMTDARGRELWALDGEDRGRVGQPDADRFWVTKEKDPGRFRVLSIGESTTFGLGYHGEASYSRFLEVRLRKQLGRETIEVVNLGKNGNDSSDWPTLAPELADFAPDLVVVYVGHNELKKPNLLGVLEPAKARLRRSRLLRRLLGEPVDDRPEPPPAIEVGPFLTPAQRAFALELFDDGLRALLDFGRDHHVPVIVCVPASNVLDNPPRLSVVSPEPRGGVDATRRLAEVQAAGALFGFGPLPAADDPQLAAELVRVERALAADPDAAVLHFRRGRMLLAAGRTDDAKAAFARSLALDGLPERASPDLVARTRELARGAGVLVADVESRFEREAALGVAGRDLFIDYCHPNLFGHWLIADELLRTLAASGLLGAPSAFDAAREPGTTLRERFDAACRELGLSEAKAAAWLVEQAKLQVGNLGTRRDVAAAEWKVPEEFLRAAEIQDPTLPQRSAVFCVLRAVGRAALGDGDQARQGLEAAVRISSEETKAIAQQIAGLPGLVVALRGAGITIDPSGFRWK